MSPCLTYSGFRDAKHLSVEHIAPRAISAGWENVWDNKEMVHQLGNLVLVQREANSSFSNRSWVEKRTLYAALSAPSHADAEKILVASGIDFGDRAQEIAKQSVHMPHLAAVSRKSDAWTPKFIVERSERLLGLAWDQLYSWLA